MSVRLKKIMGVYPLEPCLVTAKLEKKQGQEEEEIPVATVGFYDPVGKRFISLDGKSPTEDFNHQFVKFIQEQAEAREDIGKTVDAKKEI